MGKDKAVDVRCRDTRGIERYKEFPDLVMFKLCYQSAAVDASREAGEACLVSLCGDTSLF